MSFEMVITCDYGDGMCTEELRGLAVHTKEWYIVRWINKNKWGYYADDKHLCPAHKKQAKENMNAIKS